MKKPDNPDQVKIWAYHDERIGMGFSGTREHIVMQAQEAYLRNKIEFRDKEIAARVDDYMCLQGFARPCSERVEGLGDLVHLAITFFDKVAGTNYGANHCPNCDKRQESLNRMVPFQ